MLHFCYFPLNLLTHRDLYESKDLGENSKSVTFRVTIQSKDKTLDEKDLEQIHNNILEKVSNKFKANIRT